MNKKQILIRSRLLLPLSERLGLDTRIEDGYLLIEGEIIKEVGRYTPETGERILGKYRKNLRVIGMDDSVPGFEEEIPCLDAVLLPGFVKAHGHDHESPLIGIAKAERSTFNAQLSTFNNSCNSRNSWFKKGPRPGKDKRMNIE